MAKNINREDVIAEIEKIKEELESYKSGASSLPKDFSYPKAIKRLQFLRNSITRRKRNNSIKPSNQIN